MSAVWFAMARLANSTMGMHIWSATINEMHTVVSRVMEKGSEYPVAILVYIFSSRPDLASYKNIIIWADGGSNLKSCGLIGSVGYNLLDKFGWHSVRFEYGCPKHFKSLVDGHFGTLSRILSGAEKRIDLVDLSDVKKAYDDYFSDQAKIFPNAPKQTIHEFVPPPKQEVPVAWFTRSSMFGIRHSFSWSITRLDRRRANLHGREAHRYFVLTGLQLRNHIMTGKRAVAERTGFPELSLEAAAADDGGEDPPEAQQEEILLRDTKNFQGWRCSYAKLEDNDQRTRLQTKHLGAQQDFIGAAFPRLDEAQRHAQPESVMAMEQARSARQRLRHKTEAVFYKRIRRGATAAAAVA